MASMTSLYIKAGAVLLIVGLIFGLGWHLGGLSGQASLARLERDQAQITATAVLNERAAAEDQAAKDHITEQTHAATILQIDSAPAITAPLIVYHPAQLTIGPVQGSEGEAGAESAHTSAGGSQPVDRGSDRRPAVEALKKRLEKVMADYRQEDKEWPTKVSKPPL